MKKLLLFCLVFAMVLSMSALASAEWKWSRSVELVCPFGSGGGTDTSLRALLPFLEKELGVSVIINNRPGSSGLVGAEYFISQPADGYSYLMITPSHTIHDVTGAMSFKMQEATESICILNAEDYVLMAPKGAPYNDLVELGEYAKKHPGDVTIACISMGGSDEFALNNLTAELGIEVTLVPYSSGAEQIAALLGGFVDLMLSAPSESGAYIDSGDMKGLGILSQERNDVLPDVKCCADMGLKMNFMVFRGMVARKGVPQEALESMRAAFTKAAQAQGWKDWLASNGLKSDCFGDAAELDQTYADMYKAVELGMSMSDAVKK